VIRRTYFFTNRDASVTQLSHTDVRRTCFLAFVCGSNER